jgi:DNA modification methylase
MYSDESDNILDPFAGSGTTGRACIKTKRGYVMVDINEKGLRLFNSSILK